MEIVINNETYNLHSVDNSNYDDYKELLSTTNICDKIFISNTYEELSYSMLEEPDFVGFFLTDTNNTNIYVSVVVDLTCSVIKDKYTSLNFTNSVEISLLCANYNNRVIGLTKFFFNLVINQYIPTYKSNIDKIYLRIAMGSTNQQAINFYLKVGFDLVEEKSSLMMYNYSKGGMHKKNKSKRKKRNKKNTKKIKIRRTKHYS